MGLNICRVNTIETDNYRFIEKLLTEAFPTEEYRELADFRFLTMYESRFHNNLIFDDGVPVGFITYWDMDQFCYVEHFAILPGMRSRGYGCEVLEYLKTRINGSIVLEVELPVEEAAKRRVAFYQRQGFQLWQRAYLQPPYRLGGCFFPLFLMAYGPLDEAADFDRVRGLIYRVVYNYRE